MQEKLLNYCNLSVFSDSVIKFIFDKNKINGFITQSGKIIKSAVYDHSGDIGGLLTQGMRKVAEELGK